MRRIIITSLSLIIAFCVCTSLSFGASDVVIKDYNKIPTLTVGQSYTIYGLLNRNPKLNELKLVLLIQKQTNGKLNMMVR